MYNTWPCNDLELHPCTVISGCGYHCIDGDGCPEVPFCPTYEAYITGLLDSQSVGDAMSVVLDGIPEAALSQAVQLVSSDTATELGIRRNIHAWLSVYVYLACLKVMGKGPLRVIEKEDIHYRVLECFSAIRLRGNHEKAAAIIADAVYNSIMSHKDDIKRLK